MGLGYLKSNTTDPRIEIRLFDCVIEGTGASSPEVEHFLRDFRPHIVGVSAWSAYFSYAIELLSFARMIDPNVITLAGGVHPSAYPAETAREKVIDFVISGEAEFSFGIFLGQFFEAAPDWSRPPGLCYCDDSGALRMNPVQLVTDLDQINIPDYDFINLPRYIDAGYRMKSPTRWNAPIWASRGCPYRCEFCSAPVINGKSVRYHSIPYLVEWVRHLVGRFGVRWINIVDDNFTYDVKTAKEFCRAVIDLDCPKLGFGTSNGVRMQRGDAELWKLMKRAGWRTIIVAPESGSPRTLKLMKKDLDLKIVAPILREIRGAGLRVHGFFMAGYPGETPEDLKMTEDFIFSAPFDSVVIQQFLPLPGTPIYEKLVRDGLIDNRYLPDNFGFGHVRFVDECLRDFDFSRYILSIQLRMAMRHPWIYLGILFAAGKSHIVESVAHLLGGLVGRKKTPSSMPLPGLQ